MRNLVVEVSALLRRDGIGRKRLTAGLPKLREVHDRLTAGAVDGRWPHLQPGDAVVAQAVAAGLGDKLAVVGQPGAVAALQAVTQALGTRQPVWIVAPNVQQLALLDAPEVGWLVLEGPAWVDRVAEQAVANGRRVAVAGPGAHEAPPDGWWVSDPLAGDGRFAPLSTASLVCATWAGVDIGALLNGAADVAQACRNAALFENPAYTFALATVSVERDVGTTGAAHLVTDPRLEPFAAWCGRMWGAVSAELVRVDSVVKHAGVGALHGIVGDEELIQLLLVGRRDKLVYVWDATGHQQDPWSRESALHAQAFLELCAQENIPHLRVRLPPVDAATLGGMFLLASHAAVTAALFQDLDPLDLAGVPAWYAALERLRVD